MPAVTGTSAGPMSAGVVVPAATTDALIVPAGRSALVSLPFTRFVNAGLPLASTSTAGAAAVCATARRPLPAAAAETSFTNVNSVGFAAASRPATRLAFAPAGRSTLLSITAVAEAGSAPALKILIAYEPAGRESGPATLPGAKFGRVFLPFTYTSTDTPGTPCTT